MVLDHQPLQLIQQYQRKININHLKAYLMKKYIIIIGLVFVYFSGFSQHYELGLVHLNNYDFKIVAIPNFESSVNTDVSDIGFTLVLPAGASDIINETSLLAGRIWNVSQFDAAFLTGQSLGDGTKDVFQFNMPPGQSILSHSAGQQIDLVSFQVSNMPTEEELYFLLNSDAIAVGAGGVLDSFYNSDIDGLGIGAGTSDYFSGIDSNMDSFSFSTLGIEDVNSILSQISVYPNPFSDYLNISTRLKIESITLFDLQGREVTSVLNAETINVSGISAGAYLIKIKTSKGTVIKRLIKK